MEPLRVAVAQPVAVPGEIERNVETGVRLLGAAAEQGAAVVVFPELFLCCYDLEAFARDPERSDVRDDDPRLEPLRDACRAESLTAVVGASVRVGGARRISALVLGEDGETVVRADKVHLDRTELPLFEQGQPAAIDVRGWPLAIGI